MLRPHDPLPLPLGLPSFPMKPPKAGLACKRNCFDFRIDLFGVAAADTRRRPCTVTDGCAAAGKGNLVDVTSGFGAQVAYASAGRALYYTGAPSATYQTVASVAMISG